VTGKSISNIDGLIKANGTANLFLINPNGIIFGSNASLNIGGSFLASTASAVKFADGTEFSATVPETTPLLTISVPLGLQFGGNAGSILNQSQATNSSGLVTGLKVRSGNTLALVGGDVKLDGGNLQAPGGRVELGGLSGAGTVGIDTGVAPLRFPDNVARADVSLINDAQVNVRAGGGGSIAINAQNLNLAGESKLRAGIASGLGSVDSKAGNIEINATGAIKLSDGSFIANVVQPEAIGNAGDTNIQAESISSTDGSKIIASTFGRGDAGNVTINARDTVSFDDEKRQDRYYPSPYGGVYSRVEKEAVGHGGNINITTGSLSITNGAVLTTSIYGQGDAGNAYINARDTVSFDGEGRISKQPSGVYSTVNREAIGQGGNVNIAANSLRVTDGGTLYTSTLGQGDGGNVNVKVSGAVDIAGKVGTSPSGIFSYLGTGAVGNGGNINIDAGSLSLRDGAQLAADTNGQGNAGNVTVRVRDSVSLANGRISSRVQPSAVGKGGNIGINAASLSLTDGAQLLTRTASASNTQPAGQGDAGNINLNVTGAIDIARKRDKTSSGIFSYLGTGTVGNGGNITIDAGSLSLRDGARLSAETYGQGNAGTIKVNAGNFVTISGKNSNLKSALFVFSKSRTGTAGDIIVTSPRVTLDNGGTLNAQSASGNGGDINLQTDLLLLRRGSQISTTAGTAQAGGDGGNITINAPNGFIVAVPNENSNITANAFSGFGGSVKINATSIFGIKPRSREDLERLRPNDLDPSQLPTNDITAISQTNPSLSGQITLNIPNVDPNSGLINLPVVPIDTQVAQTCTPGSSQSKSEFVVTGRGGLPPSPDETLSSDAIQVDWVTLNQKVENRNQDVSTNITTPEPNSLVEAQGWAIAANGEVILTANAPTVTPHNSWQTPADCHASITSP
jgi:large exoprotein involved in heme utilization and adhesion